MPILMTKLANRALIQISGDDATSFMQGLVSNDVTLINEKTSIYAAMLTPQGKFLHEMILSSNSAGILIDTERQRYLLLLKSLGLFRLRKQVIFTDLSQTHSSIAIWGDDCYSLFNLAKIAGAAAVLDYGSIAVDPRNAGLGLRLHIANELIDDLANRLNINWAEFADWDIRRLQLAIPDGSRDILVDKSLLLEANFEELNGVSFSKGCYIGQELTARTKYRALLRRRLFPVSFIGTPPPPGTLINSATDPQVNIGIICSGQENIALAFLRIDAVNNKLELLAGDLPIQPLYPAILANTTE